MEKYKKLFSNTAIFAVSNVISKIVLSLLLPLYTRKLSTTEYGTAELLTTISQLAIPICSFAIQDAMFRFCMDKNEKHENVLKTTSFIAGIASIGLYIISIALKWYTPLAEWKWYFLSISILTMIRSILSLYVKAINKTLIFSIDNVLYNAILAVSNVLLLAFINLGLSGYFYAIIVANIVSSIYLVSAGKLIGDFYLGKYDHRLKKKMITYSYPLILNSISWGLTHLTDKVMLTFFCTASATGIYSAASKIPSILSMVTSVFCQAWTLSAIQDYQEEKDSSFYKNVFFILHIGTVICALIVFVFNNNMLVYILGKNFKSSTKYVPVLIVGTVFLAYSNFYSPIYSAMKLSKQLMYSSLGGMILNIMFNGILVPSIGIMGACIATAISYIFIGIYRMIDSYKYFPIAFSKIKWFSTVVCIFIISIFVTFDKFSVLISLIGIVMVMIFYKKEISLTLKKIFKAINLRRKY